LADLEVVEDDQFTTAPDQIDLADCRPPCRGILGVRAQERGIAIDAPNPTNPRWRSASSAACCRFFSTCSATRSAIRRKAR
jgi:hypothetical protein